SHHNVEAVALRVRQHFVEAGTILAAFSAGYPGIGEGLDYLPSSGLGGFGQPGNLVFYRLPVCTDADVQGCALHDDLPLGQGGSYKAYPKSNIFGWAHKGTFGY